MSNNKHGIIGIIISLIGIFIAFVLSRFFSLSFLKIDLNIILLFICCILGIVFSLRQRKSIISTAGLVIGVMGILLGVYVLLFVFNPIYDPVICGFQDCHNRQDWKAYDIIRDAQTKADCDKIKMKTPYRKDDCYDALVGVTDDITFCELIEFPPAKDRCYYNNAPRLGDPLLCDKITGPFVTVEECLERVQNYR
jgi:hypothetical protein